MRAAAIFIRDSSFHFLFPKKYIFMQIDLIEVEELYLNKYFFFNNNHVNIVIIITLTIILMMIILSTILMFGINNNNNKNNNIYDNHLGDVW